VANPAWVWPEITKKVVGNYQYLSLSVKLKGEKIMANVKLAPVLRPSAGGSKVVSAQGSTLAQVLDDLYQRFPALKEQIQPAGELSKFVNVYINDQDARYLQGLQTIIASNDTVTLLPAMAGGF
jgi:molybdopterin converting factor small subunit